MIVHLFKGRAPVRKRSVALQIILILLIPTGLSHLKSVGVQTLLVIAFQPSLWPLIQLQRRENRIQKS